MTNSTETVITIIYGEEYQQIENPSFPTQVVSANSFLCICRIFLHCYITSHAYMICSLPP